ncbi:membrane protein insertase YidC [Thalassotalea sp. LPB0316]|uniref:membrane protein insertase YidC n=1 Tax=Thalassotalea sp. LPB0316 TaxID=2769490 RepID=UPI0018686D03|nr:membrane protein insertase YidC [Thalassotalea sp. LPB0316]QOL26387.1 membrane protein insertase YidC [Thalassotalea sp. LPB0316]
MESQRSLLFIALLVVSFLLFQQWQLENAPIQVQQQPQVTQDIQSEQTNNDDFVPASSQAQPKVDVVAPSAQMITVTTDVVKVKINSQGGDITEVALLEYDTEQGDGIPYTMLQNGARKYIAQSGLTGANGPDRLIPGRPIYQVEKTDYQLNDQGELQVNLVLNQENGLNLVKTYTFTKGKYDIGLAYTLTNNTAQSASVQLYGQLKQSTFVDESSAFIPTYRGAAFSTTDERYEKYDFADIADANLNKTTRGGWVAMLEHYFVSAWVPQVGDNNQLYTNYTSNGDAVIGFKAPAITVDANQTTTTTATLYVGPKLQDELAAIADGLDLTVDFGFLFMISQPLHWLLLAIQSVVSNWGVAIIIITLIVKGVMYPLTKAQYTSMAKMRDLQPKMQQLKERYGDDRQKMGQATMELYRKEKVNPAGGCLPMLIQMPIFLALYWVFLESVELRHASFGLWLTDLSSKDPYYILPILMGVSMYVMQKMQPMTVQDPMQQKIMQYMPVMFTVFFFWFPSGLVLYWLVSNIISIVQMKMIFRGMEKAKQK